MPLTQEEQEQFDTINKKLDVIDGKVTEEEPSFWAKYGSYLKWAVLGLAWVIGAISHKWGLFHLLSKVTD